MKALLAAVLATAISSSVFAQDNMIGGERYPDGFTPVEIKNGVYPRVYFPNTELLGPTEMRVTALGTGMPNVITGAQKASAWYVELGNGDKFLFDVGSGSMENLAKLRPDWSKVDKVFASHLHSDHVGGFAELYIGGWMNGRYTPLHFYGPSGSEPRLGSAAFVENQIETWAWDIEGRRTGFPIAGGQAIAHEFDFRNEGPIYEENGVTISSFPAIHSLDGSVSFRLDWGNRSFVFGGDSYPNKWFIKHAKDAELVIHECFFTPELLGETLDTPPAQAIYISAYIHTPPEAFGKIMSEVKPRHAVGYHFWTWHDTYDEMLERVRSMYDGPLTLARDMTVWNVTDEQVVVREASVDENVAPTGTTQAYRQAKREPPSVAADWISPDINAGKWEGYTPPPLPEQ
ncbi:guanitoxin biosynthesis MBL fold metallo-hydrolase GntH [Roseibium sp.]|uniref:guanitoxin biosynthesis MBL fold metallo-hydrolase GntH n=1 Tax=Roseibium sp. TaxID=1936156 RepID=UPI003B504DD9